MAFRGPSPCSSRGSANQPREHLLGRVGFQAILLLILATFLTHPQEVAAQEWGPWQRLHGEEAGSGGGLDIRFHRGSFRYGDPFPDGRMRRYTWQVRSRYAYATNFRIEITLMHDDGPKKSTPGYRNLPAGGVNDSPGHWTIGQSITSFRVTEFERVGQPSAGQGSSTGGTPPLNPGVSEITFPTAQERQEEERKRLEEQRRQNEERQSLQERRRQDAERQRQAEMDRILAASNAANAAHAEREAAIISGTEQILGFLLRRSDEAAQRRELEEASRRQAEESQRDIEGIRRERERAQFSGNVGAQQITESGGQPYTEPSYRTGNHESRTDYQAELTAGAHGDVLAQVNLGLRFEKGRELKRRDDMAVHWYRLAADQGNAVAQVNLGVMYEDGRGVQQSDAEAASLYRLAANQGNARAQFALGAMYESGRGVERSDAEAVRWYRLAAEQGHRQAQEWLRQLESPHEPPRLGAPPPTEERRLTAEEVEAERERSWIVAYNLGVEAMNAGNLEAALEQFLSADQKWQGRPEARLDMAMLQHRLGDSQAAIHAYRGALEIMDRHSSTFSDEEHDEWRRVAMFDLAALLAATNQDGAAEVVYGSLLDLGELDAGGYLTVGTGLFRAGDYVRSAEAFGKLVSLVPNGRVGKQNWMVALFRGEKWGELIPLAIRSIELDPFTVQNYHMLAEAFGRTGERLMAERQFRRMNALPFALEDLALNGAEVTGGLRNMYLAPDSEIDIRFFFIGRDGAEAGFTSVLVQAPERGRSIKFNTAWEDGDVVGYRYEVVSHTPDERTREAAKMGWASAQNALAETYMPRDPAEAIYWYRHAAEQHHPRALRELAIMYAAGEHLAKDQEESRRLATLAEEAFAAASQSRFRDPYGDPAAGPTFSPSHVAPQLQNQEELRAAVVALYPPQLRAAGVGGDVMLLLLVGKDGRVKAALTETSEENEALLAASFDAAKAMSFSPAVLDGRPVSRWVAIPITFTTNTSR